MPNKKRLRLVVIIALSVAAVTGVVFALPLQFKTRTNSIGDKQLDGKLSKAVTATAVRAGGASPAQSGAAARNNSLRYELDWTFGGKPQRGWNLYHPLISELIGTDANAGSNEFATALARWQSSAGLAANGVLEDKTLYKMVETWQSRRLKDRALPTPEQVLTVSAPEFYDPQRAAELRQVERRTYAAYKRMLAAAIADRSLGLRATANGELAPAEQYLKIISAYRSREYQKELHKREPNAGRAGLAVNSPHFTGRALDLYVGGEPVTTKDANRAIQTQTRVYKWLVKNAAKFGFRPYFYEPWHWEYVGN